MCNNYHKGYLWLAQACHLKVGISTTSVNQMQPADISYAHLLLARNYTCSWMKKWREGSVVISLNGSGLKIMYGSDENDISQVAPFKIHPTLYKLPKMVKVDKILTYI